MLCGTFIVQVPQQFFPNLFVCGRSVGLIFPMNRCWYRNIEDIHTKPWDYPAYTKLQWQLILAECVFLSFVYSDICLNLFLQIITSLLIYYDVDSHLNMTGFIAVYKCIRGLSQFFWNIMHSDMLKFIHWNMLKLLTLICQKIFTVICWNLFTVICWKLFTVIYWKLFTVIC